MKHTPGPWNVTLIAPPGSGGWPLHRLDITPEGMTYALKDDGQPSIPMDEAEANARLIEAAPDLLDACRAALAALRDLHGGVAGLHAGDACRAAIKRAEGGER